MNKNNLELDTTLDGVVVWAEWTTPLFNALFVHDISRTDYTMGDFLGRISHA